jgi:hypothetical protein
MTLALLVPIWDPDHPKGCIQNMRDLAQGCDADVLAFLHSDVIELEEHWTRKVALHFLTHPRCGLLGFGGATALGHPHLYKRPYQLQQLARFNYFSAQRDWQTHGKWLSRPMQVAVLDGFALVFRREAYEQMGGWQAALDLGLMFHMYDAAACCMMARLGWEVWALPIECWHRGAAASISSSYDQWLKGQGINGDSEVHEKAHRIVYREFKDVLPLEVPCQLG